MTRRPAFRRLLALRPLALAAILLPPRAPAPPAPRVDVDERRLPNGLTLLMIEHRQAPVVSCSIFYRVGSANEEPGRTGISHLLEHMMFKGTRTVGTRDWAGEKPLLERIERLNERLEEAGDAGGDPAEAARLRREIEETERAEEPLLVRNELWKLYMASGARGLNAGTGKDRTQ